MKNAVNISFGSGDLSGGFGTDLCTLGGAESNLEIKDFSFGSVLKQRNIFNSFDALVGLAYPSMAHENHVPLFDQLMATKQLENNLFAFFLSFNPKQEESELTLGYYDEARYVPETLHWHDVTNPVFFAVELLDVRIGEKSLNLCGPSSVEGKNCTITPDSGTSAITMPDWAWK